MPRVVSGTELSPDDPAFEAATADMDWLNDELDEEGPDMIPLGGHGYCERGAVGEESPEGSDSISDRGYPDATGEGRHEAWQPEIDLRDEREIEEEAFREMFMAAQAHTMTRRRASIIGMGTSFS